MTYLDLPRPALTRATIISIARNPRVELAVASLIFACLGFAVVASL